MEATYARGVDERHSAPLVRAGEGPDFICIGMEKAGTGWLFDQLQQHPDFWMPPVKGLHYLDDDFPRMKNARTQLHRFRKRQPRSRRGRRLFDVRDQKFLQELLSHSGEPRNIAHYISFFRYKDDRLSGDITAPYFMLKEEVIREIAEHLPNTKVVLLVRDPVARLWSHLSMSYRESKFDHGLLDHPEKFRAFLETSRSVRNRSFSSRAVTAWRQNAPAVAFRHFFFDDIANDPESARRRIMEYLGADPGRVPVGLAAGFNRKGNAPKLAMSDDIKEILVGYFREELDRCAILLNGHAKEWKARYGA